MQLKQEFRQSLKQEQWMKMHMMQFMRVLQLSQIELRNEIQAELEKNPMLEIKEKEEGDADRKNSLHQESAAPDDIPAQVLAQGGISAGFSRGAFRGEDKSTAQIIEATAYREPSLHDHLLEQFYLCDTDFLQTKIGEFLIGNIDERGYLKTTTHETAQLLKVDEKKVEDVLRIVQGLDPVGVGARDLAECLLIQAKILELDARDLGLLQTVVREHLEDLAKGRFNKIAKILNIKEPAVREINLKIKELNPYPGQSYFKDEARKVVPEIIVVQDQGKYEVVFDDKRTPQLGLSSIYMRMLKEKDNSAKEYLRSKVISARMFIRAIDQRRRLLQKIAEALLLKQKDFFEKGINYLRPLTLEDMARANDVHASTISRAISNKYIQTSRGIFPLKFFFSVHVGKDSDVSSRSIKDRIAALIEKEDGTSPLSDSQMVQRLKTEGIEVSRRTVAKYREAAGIPSTFKRRKV